MYNGSAGAEVAGSGRPARRHQGGTSLAQAPDGTLADYTALADTRQRTVIRVAGDKTSAAGVITRRTTSAPLIPAWHSRSAEVVLESRCNRPPLPAHAPRSQIAQHRSVTSRTTYHRPPAGCSPRPYGGRGQHGGADLSAWARPSTADRWSRMYRLRLRSPAPTAGQTQEPGSGRDPTLMTSFVVKNGSKPSNGHL